MNSTENKSSNGCDGVFTISVQSAEGHDNLANTISDELLTETQFSRTSSSHPITTHPDTISQNTQPSGGEQTTTVMTPPPLCRINRKTAFGVDFIIVAIVAVWLILIEVGIFPHLKRGFFCNDQYISFPFTGDTITPVVLGVSVIVPFFMIWIVEAIFCSTNTLKSSRLFESWMATLRWYKEFVVGMVLKLFIVDGLKVIVGELRPHFLHTCMPDMNFNCTPGQFITEYECTNKVDSAFNVRDASKSFPSGHSSIGFFEAIFMVWYLQNRVPKIRSMFTIPFVQILCLLWGFLCGVTRITDHRHHWWDVLVGGILGVIFAVLTCTILCKNFRRRDKSPVISANNHQNGAAVNYHNSVRRLLSDNSYKDEVILNRVTSP